MKYLTCYRGDPYTACAVRRGLEVAFPHFDIHTMSTGERSEQRLLQVAFPVISSMDEAVVAVVVRASEAAAQFVRANLQPQAGEEQQK